MIPIVICGDKSDDCISKLIKRILSIYEFNGVCELIEDENIPNIDMDHNGIVVFKNSFKVNKKKVYFKNFISIFESQNTKVKDMLRLEKNKVISCGMSLKDTLSISSLDFSSAMVSLQREIINLSLTKIEPHEFKISFDNNIGPYPLLASVAVLLLIDTPKYKKYNFSSKNYHL